MPGLDRRCELDRAVERDPAHHLRMQEVPRLAAHLPDPVVDGSPVLGGRIGDPAKEPLRRWVEGAEVRTEAVSRAEQLPVDIQLSLPPGVVADANRSAVTPPLEVRKLAFTEVVLLPDPEN